MKNRFLALLAGALVVLAIVIVLTPPIFRGSEDGAGVEADAGAPADADGSVLDDPPTAPGGTAAGGDDDDPDPGAPGATAPEKGATPGIPGVPATEQETAPTLPPASREAADALRARGDTDSLFEARRMYSDLVLRGLRGSDREEVMAYIRQANERLFFSPEPCPGAHFYTVQPGDSLSRIATQEGQGVGVIMASNWIKNQNLIRVGARLKIIEGRVWLKVDTEALRMQLMCDQAIVLEFPIGVGSYGRTPNGTFAIETRIEEPDWYTPNGGVIRFGAEGHAIGTRWLGFKPTREFEGYGIHGTNDPGSVPGRESAGCIRMLNEHVEELYPLIARGTPVEIE